MTIFAVSSRPQLRNLSPSGKRQDASQESVFRIWLLSRKPYSLHLLPYKRYFRAKTHLLVLQVLTNQDEHWEEHVLLHPSVAPETARERNQFRVTLFVSCLPQSVDRKDHRTVLLNKLDMGAAEVGEQCIDL